MRELQFIRTGTLAWRERPEPILQGPRDALIRPFIAGRCHGDTMPIHRHVSRAMQLGMRTGLVDPIVASICGTVPFQGPFDIPRRDYDVVVEGTSSAAGVDLALRSLAPGGLCRPVGYYLPVGTKVPLMHMYANDASLHIGVSHVRPVLPELLNFLVEQDFPAEEVTTMTADWDDAPAAYRAHTTKLVLQRPRITR